MKPSERLKRRAKILTGIERDLDLLRGEYAADCVDLDGAIRVLLAVCEVAELAEPEVEG